MFFVFLKSGHARISRDVKGTCLYFPTLDDHNACEQLASETHTGQILGG